MPATDYFLKLDQVPGESLKVGHEKEMELNNWNFSAYQTGTSEIGAGLSAGRVSLSDFSFSKIADSATAKLLQMMFTGQHLKNAIMTARRSGESGGEPVDYLKWEYTDVIVSGHSYNGVGGASIPEENVTLRFTKAVMFYREIKQGVPQGVVSGGWDSKANKAV